MKSWGRFGCGSSSFDILWNQLEVICSWHSAAHLVPVCLSAWTCILFVLILSCFSPMHECAQHISCHSAYQIFWICFSQVWRTLITVWQISKLDAWMSDSLLESLFFLFRNMLNFLSNFTLHLWLVTPKVSILHLHGSKWEIRKRRGVLCCLDSKPVHIKKLLSSSLVRLIITTITKYIQSNHDRKLKKKKCDQQPDSAVHLNSTEHFSIF